MGFWVMRHLLRLVMVGSDRLGLFLYQDDCLSERTAQSMKNLPISANICKYLPIFADDF